MALSGYGRGDDVSRDDEANSVFLQVIDPSAFGPMQNFLRQTTALMQLWEQCESDSDEPLRIPGKRAWSLRNTQLEEGVQLYPSIVGDLKKLAEKTGISMPEAIS